MFQYLLVRLKEGELTERQIKYIEFQYLLVRLKDRRIFISERQTAISIPLGTIKSIRKK